MGPPHKVYVPPHPSPPITALSPCTCPPPPIWGGTSPPPYHQGLGKTLARKFTQRCEQIVSGREGLVKNLWEKLMLDKFFMCTSILTKLI